VQRKFQHVINLYHPDYFLCSLEEDKLDFTSGLNSKSSIVSHHIISTQKVCISQELFVINHSSKKACEKIYHQTTVLLFTSKSSLFQKKKKISEIKLNIIMKCMALRFLEVISFPH
jgi:hypothetical protein